MSIHHRDAARQGPERKGKNQFTAEAHRGRRVRSRSR